MGLFTSASKLTLIFIAIASILLIFFLFLAKVTILLTLLLWIVAFFFLEQLGMNKL